MEAKIMVQEMLSDYLKDKSIISEDLYIDTSPDDANLTVSMIEYRGFPVNPIAGFEHRNFQILVKGPNAFDARSLSNEIMDALVLPNHELKMTYKGMNVILLVYVKQTPFKIKEDVKGNKYYAFNIGVTISNSII